MLEVGLQQTCWRETDPPLLPQLMLPRELTHSLHLYLQQIIYILRTFPSPASTIKPSTLIGLRGRQAEQGLPNYLFSNWSLSLFFFFCPRTFCPLLPQPVLFVFDWVSQKQRLKRDSHESCFSPRGALGRKGMEEAGQGQSRQLRASFRVASWEARNSFNHSLKYYLINNIRIMY